MIFNNLFMRVKRSMVLCLMLMVSAVAMAVPAKPGLTRTLTLTDGTTISARLVGDEHGHFWLGQDGKAYSINNEGVATTVDAEIVKARAQARRQQANARRVKRLAPRKVGDVGSITGQKKGLIILVNFKSTSFKSANNNALYQRIANEVNFSYGDFKGSMYDYFYAQSDGQFQLTFDVVGPVTVSNTQSYYGANDSQGNDKYPAKMVIEALKLANSQVNYADYDWDGDGKVEQVYVVYAGQGEADGGAANTIWPHEWELSSAAQYGDGSGAQTLDGVTIDTYACGGELNGSGNIAGIGTMCHEFSHCLGYPDFYDTDYSGGQGMGYWDLMDGGSYNDDGYQPAGYTSYERWVAGWATPTELTTTQQVSNMPDLQTSGQSYVIYNPGNRNEYFLLENRQETGWDASLPGAGLLILHVDYSSSAWASNGPNDDPSHQRMTWIAADNDYAYVVEDGKKYYTFSGMANDPFPYGTVNAFGATTTPAAELYNGNTNGTYYLDSSVENITQNSDKTVSFKFVGQSNVATPTFSPKAGRYSEAQTVTISCETSGSTIYYTLDGTAPTTSSSVYSQPLTISETTTIKAIAVADGEESATATAKYTIGQTASDPTATTFRLVSSVDDLEPGLRYIIACGSKATAAGAHNSTYLGKETVTVSNDVITIGSGVAVFVLEGDQDTGWTFQNESTDQYLYATALKKLAYGSDENVWTLSNGTAGVIMTYGSYGTMLYNASDPRFTTYTSTPNASMIQANLYMEDSSVTPTIPDPVIVADETLSFSTPVGTPQTNTFEVLTENLTENVTLTLNDQNNVFSLGQNTIASTETDTNVSVTFTPTQAGTYTATVTLSSAGAESVTVTLTGTATEPMNPNDAYTVAEVLDMFANSNVPTDSVYVKGIVSQIKSLDTSKYQRAQYYISDDGTTTDQFYVYNGYYLNKTDFTSDDQLAVGDTVVVYGLLTTYNSTNEFAANNYLVYLQRPNPKSNVELTFSAATASATLGESFTAPTLTTDPAGLSVTYSSSKESVATVDATTGAVTLVGGGVTVITASFEGNNEYYSAEAWYTLTVTDPNNTNSQDNPYNVAEVLDMFSNNAVPSMAVYVKGIVSEITSLDPSKYTNARYYISDDGTTTDQFYVYNGKYLGNTDFTSDDQLAVGDTVIVYGELTTYNTTNEFAAGNYIVYLGRPESVTPPTPSGDGYYVKVTSAPTDWSGQYLIVYEEGSVAMTGSATTATDIKKPSSVVINNDMIEATSAMDDISVTIETDATCGYTIKTASGYYIYHTSSTSNGFSVNTSLTTAQKYAVTLGLDADGNADITAAGAYLRYNTGNSIFNYYKVATYTGQQAIQLYKKVESTTPTLSISFATADVSLTVGDTYTQTVTTNSTGAVTYSSSNPSVATVDAQTGLVTAIDAGTTTITATVAATETLPQGSASYTVTVTAAPVPSTDKYELVTDASTLAAGDEILIAYIDAELTDTYEALGTTQNKNNRASSVVTYNSDGTVTPGTDTQVITLEKQGDNFLFNVGTGYLYAASSSSNHLKTETPASDNAQAVIVISTDGEATITFQGTNTRNVVRYNPNNGSPIFSCYASDSSTGYLPQIYRKVTTPDTPVLTGDVNNSGSVEWTDVPALARVLTGHTTSPDGAVTYNLKAADVNNDTQISLADLTKLINDLQ